MLAQLSGRTHEVVSGPLPARPGLGGAAPRRHGGHVPPARADEIERYVAAGEWEGRAGAYAIQGLGASLVERIDGDYLNVVGLPAALLVRLLAERSRHASASTEPGTCLEQP